MKFTINLKFAEYLWNSDHILRK